MIDLMPFVDLVRFCNPDALFFSVGKIESLSITQNLKCLYRK